MSWFIEISIGTGIENRREKEIHFILALKIIFWKRAHPPLHLCNTTPYSLLRITFKENKSNISEAQL